MLKICTVQLIESIISNKNIILQLNKHLSINIKHNMNDDLDNFKEMISTAKKKYN